MALDGKTVALLGDSHMEAIGPRVARALRARGTRVRVIAHRGWSTRRYLTRPDELARARGADLVVVLLGGNNQEMDASLYRAQLTQLIGQVGGFHRVLWIGPGDVIESKARETALRHDRTRRMQSVLLPALGVPWVDSYPFTRGDHAPDGVHFTRRGYDRWARAIEGKLDPNRLAGLLAGLGILAVVDRTLLS